MNEAAHPSMGIVTMVVVLRQNPVQLPSEERRGLPSVSLGPHARSAALKRIFERGCAGWRLLQRSTKDCKRPSTGRVATGAGETAAWKRRD